MPQIAAIVGSSVQYAQDVIDRYLPRNAAVAPAGIEHLEAVSKHGNRIETLAREADQQLRAITASH